MQTTQNRRRVLAALAATGVAALVRPPQSEAQEGRLETTTGRIGKIAGICIAPQYLAEELLRAEGFTDVRYVTTVPGAPAARALAHGEIDFTTNFSPPLIVAIDAGEPITMVAGVHVGCFELFAREGIRGERHGFICRARTSQGYSLGHEFLTQADGPVRGREDRRISGASARAAGIAGP